MRQTRRSPLAVRKRRVAATALIAAVGTVGAFIYNYLPTRSTSAEPPVDEPSASASVKPSVTAHPSPSATKMVTPRPSPTGVLPTPTHTRVITPSPKPTPHPIAQTKLEILIAFLHSKVGHTYEWGGTGPYSYDCSGLVQAAYRQVGITLPRTSEEQSLVGVEVRGTSSLQPGDVLFWGAPGVAYHDAIYIGNGKYIAAENTERGIGVFTIDWWPPQYARRIL